MARVTTEALALRRTPFRETSQIAEFLTRDRGRVGLILKGVMRPKSRMGGGVDLLDHCRVTYTARRGSRSMPPLVERQVLSHHPGMRHREDLMRAGLYMLELLRALVPEGQRVPGLFGLSVAFLAALDTEPEPGRLAPMTFALEGGLLRMTGFELVLDRCVSCHRRPEGSMALRCDPQRGGIVCSTCRDDEDGNYVPLSSASARLIMGLTGADPLRLRGLTLPENIENDVRRFFDRTFLHVLERPPRAAVMSQR